MKSNEFKLKEIKELLDNDSISYKEFKILESEILEQESMNILNDTPVREFNIKAKPIEKSKVKNHVIVKFSSKYITFFVLLFVVLSFHFVPSKLLVFPKANLTLSNTYLSEKDIDKIISRFNNASLMERTIMLQDPFINKLFEKDILYELNSTNDENEILPAKK